MLAGQTGILRQAQEASSKTKEAEAKEELDMWLVEWQKNKHIDGETNLKGFLEEKGAKVEERGDGKLNVQNKGYNFLVDPDTLETIEVKSKEKGTPEFTVEVGEVENKKVTVKVTITNKYELGSIDGAVLKGEYGDIKGTINGGEITFEVEKNGEYTLELKTTTEGKEKTTTGKVTVDKFTAEILQAMEYGTIEVIWLKGTSNEITTVPNEPDLYDGALTPVKWEEAEEDETDEFNSYYGSVITSFEERTTTPGDSSWYNYNANHWANAINTEDGSYFVWIPRYAYRITYYAKKGDRNPIAYYDGKGLVDLDGNIITKLNGYEVNGKIDKGIETVSKDGKSYIVHPAFMDNTENDFENGGWSKDLEGIWVAKYEMSQETSSNSGANWSTTSYSRGNVFTTKADIGTKVLTEAGTSQIRVVSKPFVSSWRRINIANMYTNSFYYDRAKESHMMKNSEWGAVVYLAHSRYGTNGYEIERNTSDSITGPDYNTEIGMLSSTTRNVYGVYDISGGANENVAGYNKDYANQKDTSYFTSMLDESGKNFANEAKGKSTQYVTAYSNNSDSTSGTTLEYNVGKTGDATKEVQTGTNTDSSHWFSSYSSVVGLRCAYFGRPVTFGSADVYGDGWTWNDSDSFRVVLAK